jgi:hypothetical protein
MDSLPQRSYGRILSYHEQLSIPAG